VKIEFAVNNKVHSVTKISPFIANYGRELRMRAIVATTSEKTNRTTKINL